MIQVSYTEFTSPVSVTATVVASSDTVVTAPALTGDGSQAYLIEFFASVAQPSNVAGRFMVAHLFDGSNEAGSLCQLTTPANAFMQAEMYGAVKITPSAAAHTYSIRAHVSAGTGTISAGTGGAGNIVPGYVRISKITT